MKFAITAEFVREILAYDKESGVLSWRVHTRNTKIGQVAGSFSNGYGQIQINGHNYRAHVLAWLIITGEWPEPHVDHINGIRSDNRWCNLRLATTSQNAINCKPRSNDLPRGVSKTGSGKFCAKLWMGGKYQCLGTHNTVGEAERAYLTAAKDYHGEYMPIHLKSRAAYLCLL